MNKQIIIINHGNFLLSRLLCLQPERIDPDTTGKGYDVRSDIWSLGISMVGLAGSGDGDIVRYQNFKNIKTA